MIMNIIMEPGGRGERGARQATSQSLSQDQGCISLSGFSQNKDTPLNRAAPNKAAESAAAAGPNAKHVDPYRTITQTIATTQYIDSS